MKFRALCLLPLMAGFCLSAEEIPPSLQAVLGIEPYADYAAAGIPLPPTAEQTAALPRRLFLARAAAMKRVLYLGMARTRDNRWRETERNLATMAREAESLADSPPEFVTILKMRAAGNLSRAKSYMLRKAQKQLLQMYAVDELQMRLLLDDVDANAKEAEQLLQHLPLHAIFNMVPRTPPDKVQMTSDLLLYARILTDACDLLKRVQDEDSARATIPDMEKLVLLHDTTIRTRALLLQGLIQPDTPEMKAAASALEQAGKQLPEQRSRLAEKNWFGCKALRALDYLLN